MKYQIQYSQKTIVNTDVYKRCYNGCNYSEEEIELPFKELETFDTLEKAKKRINFWIELNNYAVSQRGELARNKFKIIQIN